MEWTRSDTIGLASPSCKYCHGLGLKSFKQKADEPCGCVFRAIFRACYARFRKLMEGEKRLSQATLEFAPRGGGRIMWGRKNEEYIADFLLVARRELSEAEWKLFRYHFLLGADWRLCERMVKVDRGTFYHIVYRLEAKLGKVFRELQPYALFPLDEYFNGSTENEWGVEKLHKVVELREGSLSRRLDVPLKKAA